MKKYLEKLGIFNLRNLARIVGVKSPCTKTKNILINEILQSNYVLHGERIANACSRRGRPPINSNEISDFFIYANMNTDFELKQKIEIVLKINKILNKKINELNEFIKK